MGLAEDAADLLRQHAEAQAAARVREQAQATTWKGDWSQELVAMLTARRIPQRPLYHYDRHPEGFGSENLLNPSTYQRYSLTECTLWGHGWVLMGWKLGSDLEHVRVRVILESDGSIWELDSNPLELVFDSRDREGNPGIQGSTYRAYRGLAPEHEVGHLLVGSMAFVKAIPEYRAAAFREHVAVPVAAAIAAGAEPQSGMLVGIPPSTGIPVKRL